MARLEIRLLGEPSIRWDGQPWEIARRQARALLYRLAASPEPVARSQLTFLFWPDAPDTAARRNLTQRLSLLRRDLPDPRLVQTTATHVQLDRERVCVDTSQFRHLLDEAGGRQPASLAEAVDLYTGSFLGGFSLPNAPEFDQWVHAQRSEMDGLLLDALADLVDHLADKGDTTAAVAAARRGLRIDPLDEAMHRRLIRLYTAAGDRAAALQQYETCAAILERELGVDPLPETTAAYQSALAGHADAPEVPARQLAWKTQPSLHVPFTGRDDALAELGRAYRRAQSGQGGVVMVTGEAGMGKTRLVQEFAGRLPDNGLVLVGSSQRESLAAPYGSPVEALRSGLEQAARTLSDGGRRARLADLLPGGVAPIWLSEASRLLPELRALAPNLPQPIDIRDPDAARSRLFEALHRLLAALPAPRQTTLLFLDDLHWADDATVGWLSYLASKLRRSRLLLVAALRPTENANLDDLRATLSRRQALHEMALAGWDQATVQQVLERLPRLTVEDAAGMAARLHNTTGGNPFFVLSIVQEMIEGGSENGAGKLPVPGQVREVLERRVQRLQPAARQVLEAGAVLGARCDFALLQATSGRDGLETADGLDELVARQMLDPLPAGFQFHHDLIRATAYDRMSSWRRRLLHSRAADTLEERLAAVKAGTKTGTGEIEFQEIDLVRLLAEQHISAGNEKRAVPYLITIGHHLCGTYANKAAIPYFEQALDIAPESDLDTRWEVLQSMVEINWWRDDMVTWEKYTLRLLDLARRTENNHRLAISLHWMARASATGKTANLDEGLGYIRQALALAKAEGDIDLEAAIRGDWGGILWRQGDYEGSIEQRTLHLKAMRKLGNRRGEVIALYQLASIIGFQGDELLAESYLVEALTLAQEIEDQNWQAVVIAELVGFTLQRGDINTSKLLVKAASLLEISGDDLMADFIHAETNGALAMIEGNPQKAEEYFRRALTFAQLRGHTFLEAYALSEIADSLAIQRRYQEASTMFRDAAAMYQAIPGRACYIWWTRALWARAALLHGSVRLARDLVEKIVSHLERGGQLPPREALRIQIICVQVLQTIDDPRTRTLLDTIYTRMHEIADNLDDAEKRRMFLENLPWHREITAAWEAMQGKQAPVIDSAWVDQMNLETVKPG